MSFMWERQRRPRGRALAVGHMKVRMAILPEDRDGLHEDISAAGGELGDVEGADAILWTDPTEPDGLGAALGRSPARWVQLPFAGIEPFFEAGVIDSDHIWTCAKGIYGPSTAEHALALMLAAARHLPKHIRATSWVGPGSERRLKDAVVLVVGTGGIGRSLAAMLEPLEARVVGVNRSGRPLSGAERTATVKELPKLIPDADYVVLAAALTDETRGLIGAEYLSLMRPDAWLVNVGRGGLVQTDALESALRSRSIAGAALDVTDPEPLPDGHPLWELDNAIVTSHVANTWEMALPELRALVRRNVARYNAGEELEGLVDPRLGY
jgi:phosphoglycerate dehydrogenase-like enzyme